MEFALHVLSQQGSGEPVLEDNEWMHSYRYIKWFYRVSYPLIINSAPILEYDVPRPVYQVVIVEQEWVRHPLDPFQVVGDIRGRVEHVMEIPEVVSNPFFFSILKGIQSDYAVFDEVSAPLRRSRSPRDQ